MPGSERTPSRKRGTLRWIATAFERHPPPGYGIEEDAVILTAATIDEAASIALAALQDVWDESAERHSAVGDRVNSVFIAPWDGRVAYRPIPATERAELQCCAGGSHNEYTGAEGHYATCPQRPPGTGQPRDGEEDEA